MIRSVSALTIATTLFASPVASGTDLDLRCTNVDQALSERLRAVVRDLPAARAGVHEVMNRMALARVDCKRGRAERGLRVYADAAAGLAELEAIEAAFIDPAASSIETAAPMK
jgi:hypothetical protein